MNELNKDLRNQAIALGLCNDWQKLWNNDWSKEKMVERMYKGLDFCLKYHYPSNDYILKHFDLDFRRKSNVYVNDKYSVCNPKQSLVLGSSEITFRFVIVHLYEKAYVTAEQTDKATIVLIKHSPDVTIVAETNIKVKEEYDYLK